MKNEDIRKLIKEKRLKNYEVIRALKMSDNSFYVMMRNELDEEKKKEIIDVINELSSKILKGD